MAQRFQSAVWNSLVKSAWVLDKADGSIYNEGTANTDKLFAAGRRWNGRSSAGQASCLPEKGPVLHGRTAGPEGMGMKQNRPCRLVCVLCALAFALTALPMAAFAQQPEETAAVQQSLTAADVRGMQQADAAVTELTDSEDYNRMSEDERIDAALQQLEELTRQGLVKQGSVYTDAENGMVSFTYSCGALGGILVADPEEENAVALPQLEKEQLQQLAENKRVGTAAIYYAFDNTINSARYPYYAYMQTYWDSVGLQTRLDTTVTVSDLRRLWKRTATEPLILLSEKSDFWSDLRYGFDLLAHRVVKVNGMYAVNGDFFRSAYRGNGIVLSETCEFYGKNGHVDTSMADGLLAGGAKAVMGYVNNVYSVYSRSMLWAAVNRMIEGETLEQAVDYAKSIYGTDDIIWYNEQGGRRPHAAASYAMLSGSRSAVLPNPYTVEEAAAAA